MMMIFIDNLAQLILRHLLGGRNLRQLSVLKSMLQIMQSDDIYADILGGA
jgi:hypothetical protein